MLLFQRGLLFIPFKSQSIMHYYVQVSIAFTNGRPPRIVNRVIEAESENEIKEVIAGGAWPAGSRASLLMFQPASDLQICFLPRVKCKFEL